MLLEAVTVDRQTEIWTQSYAHGLQLSSVIYAEWLDVGRSRQATKGQDQRSRMTILRPLASRNSEFLTMLESARSTTVRLCLPSRSSISLKMLTWLPTHTRFRIASSASFTSSATPSDRLQPNSRLPSMVFMVDTSNRQCASSTSSTPTSLSRRILAMDSLRRMTASSCLTVMGMVFLELRSCRCSLAFWRSFTQMACSFSEAVAVRRGLMRLRAYLMYFFMRSKGTSDSVVLAVLPWCRSRMWPATWLFVSGVLMSRTMKMQSKRERIVFCSSICSSSSLRSSYRPWMGLAAASTDVREFSRVVMPAFATLIVCCSIASWMATRSVCFILSNSSMQTIPPSASTSAPPSIWNYPVEESFVMEAVRPAADEPLPEVQTAMEAACSTNLRN